MKTVQSIQGAGSIFTATYPLCRSDEAIRNTHISWASKTSSEKSESDNHVLLVEDYPANVLVATIFLEQFGYSYDVASNGQQALDKIENGNRYTAILMDVQMAGMDGLEATRSIRLFEKKKSRDRTPIIGMTAYAFSEDRERCLSVGMDDYISKPFNLNELYEKLRAYSDK